MEFSTSRVEEEDKRSGNSRELVKDDYVTSNFGNYSSEERDQRASANTKIAFKTLLRDVFGYARARPTSSYARIIPRVARGTRLGA